MHDKLGTSVLNVCIERFREPVPDGHGQIVPRALFLANKPDCELPLYFRKVKEILRIAREDGWSVAHEMASQRNLPAEMMTEDILKQANKEGCFVAYHAAGNDSFPDWAKRNKDKDILMLGNGKGDYVAHVLARLGKLPAEMMTPDILKLKNLCKQTVFSVIVSEKYLSTQIVLLPWDKKTRVFEYLRSKQFQKQVQSKQVQSKQDMIYVKEQLATFEAFIQRESISALSVIGHDCENMER